MTGFKIKKPTLVLNKDRVRRNIRRMADKARNNGVRFRPHFKTHQSAQVGEFFKEEGISSITVSSVDMAEYFAKNGWEDITIAFSVNLRQIDEINTLAEKISLNLLVESIESVDFLEKHLKSPVNIWIKIDVGYKRAGIEAEDFKSVLEVANGIKRSENLRLKGLLTHAGHSYHANSKEEIKEIYHHSIALIKKTGQFLVDSGFSGIEISVGDTPTSSIVDDFSGVDEIRPGNFVFCDVMQMILGSCSENDIAVAVACPVVAKHDQRNEIVIYGGAVHLSKDTISTKNNISIFGLVAQEAQYGWGPVLDRTFVASIAQEHGIIKTDEQNFGQINVGDLLYILPVHSCLTVNLLREFYMIEGA